jgi:alpha-glucosidase
MSSSKAEQILTGLGGAANIYGGAPDLPEDPTLPADGPTFQAWRLD